MDKIYIPKRDIKKLLDALGYGEVMQSSSNIFNELPAITFNVTSNSISKDLDNTIESQSIVVTIDLWADDSPTTSKMLEDVELAMRSLGYTLEFSSDIPNPDPTIYHTTTRFKY